MQHRTVDILASVIEVRYGKEIKYCTNTYMAAVIYNTILVLRSTGTGTGYKASWLRE